MSAKRRAGEPEVPKRQAGAPEAPVSPAGAPQESAPAQAAEEPSGEAAAQDVEKDLDRLLEDTKRERDEYLELAQRTRADFENYRKRVARETEEAARRGKASLAAELVPALDNLERALEAVGIDPQTALDGEAGSDGALEQGVILTYRELRATLDRAGIESYDPAGERFDPEWHEALSVRPQEGAAPGTVLEVVQKGYRLDGRVIRAARVIVSGEQAGDGDG
jgi:molecular chaperone GrpE